MLWHSRVKPCVCFQVVELTPGTLLLCHPRISFPTQRAREGDLKVGEMRAAALRLCNARLRVGQQEGSATQQRSLYTRDSVPK